MHDMKFIYGNAEGAALKETREVKVKLPVNLLIKLHGVKILKGRHVSDTVAEALDQYFAEKQQA